MSIIGIFAGLGVIALGAFFGWGSLPLSLMATLVVALTSGLNIWETFSVTYLSGYTSTFTAYFLIFCTTCLYSRLMTESGCAMAFALKLRDIFGKKGIMTACCLAAAILTYAGISAFVLSYVMLPIMWALFREADIPRELTICPIIFGCSTFILGCTPGCTEMTNLNPSLALGTPLTAAPVMSLILMVFLITAGLWYANRQVRLAREQGRHFEFPEGVDESRYTISADTKLPPVWKALVPTVFMMVCILGGSSFVEDARLLVVVTMCLTNIICLVLNADTLRSMNLPKLMTEGMETAVTVVGSFAAVLSFAAVVQTTPGFTALIDGMMSWNLPMYVKITLYTALTSLVLGSSASGSRVAVNSIAAEIMSSGANLQVAHRLVSMASITVDTLPHCAALFLQLRVLKLDHKHTYKHIFHLSVLQTGIACIMAVAIALIFY